MDKRWSFFNLASAIIFLIVAAFFFGASWIANWFYYEHGQTAPTEADLNRLMLIHILLVGTPLFLSGFFFGKCHKIKLSNNETIS